MGAPVSITVNCSTREFCQPQFRYDLVTLLRNENVDPRLLKIEVTESTLMDNPEVARTVVSELRAAGFRIGIDDFGTGYSSLAYLHRLPLDVLKPVRLCRLGRRHAAERVIVQESPRGEAMYWIGGAGAAKDDAEGTDFHATAQGHVSITPLKVDLTDHENLGYWAQTASRMEQGAERAPAA